MKGPVAQWQGVGPRTDRFQVRSPIPPKIRRLLLSKPYVEGQTPSCWCGVEVWRGDASSGPVIRQRLEIMRSTPKLPPCCFKTER
ncbi:hypothetical protein AVEN_209242-1 [Araneus ventricosus]|uniref:Uncharacterized protein n=1 Tax=Araneus ventricosus TaxID=182803 RepID=A0A4Y2SHF5_ARAVE|nr:hypothetical protein AVEN_209242-1 [Araneus ventricosus]